MQTGARGNCEHAILLQKVSRFNEAAAEQTSDDVLKGKSWWPCNSIALAPLSDIHSIITLTSLTRQLELQQPALLLCIHCGT